MLHWLPFVPGVICQEGGMLSLQTVGLPLITSLMFVELSVKVQISSGHLWVGSVIIKFATGCVLNSIGSTVAAEEPQGFEAKMRLVIELRKDMGNPKQRHLCIVKGNYLQSEYKEQSFVLDFDNMIFSNTGRHTPYDKLTSTKKTNTVNDDGYSTANSLISELHKQKYSIREISEKLKKDHNIKISKSTVASRMKKKKNS